MGLDWIAPPGAAPARGPRIRVPLLPLGLLALLGCEHGEPPPIEGHWQLVEKRLSTDGCDLVLPGLEGDACQLSCEPVTIRAAGEGAWEMHFGERGGTARCEARPDAWFTCTVEDTRGPVDARVHRVDTMEGRRHQDGSMRGVFALEMTCEGPGCGLQERFAGGTACQTRGTFRGERRDPPGR